MVLEMLAAYSLIIGVLVGAEHILEGMETKSQVVGAVEVPETATDKVMVLEKKILPIDTFNELPLDLEIAQPDTAEETSRPLSGVETRIVVTPPQQTTIPASLGAPNPNEELSKGTEYSTDPASKTERQKPYDIFEDVGFEEEGNGFEVWAK